ncbi:MAG TPA: hypothetical protein VHQ65_16625 [Thermoanaerobaculia bacterium]|nr:hypothetical protein [Thermoanaerobaculia bacterium]
MGPRTLRSCAVLLLLACTAPTGAAAAAPETTEPAASAVGITPATAPVSTEAVQAWYGRYRRSAAPVKRALAVLVAARREHRPNRWRRRVASACRGLGDSVEAFSADAVRVGVLPVPDRAADYHLRRGFGSLAEAASACGSGRFEAMELALGRAAGSLRQAAAVLARYGVEP